MTTASSVAAAVAFVWLGMVVAISFLEAPLKFRAPGVDIRIGLGIGGGPFAGAVATFIAVGMLTVQVGVIRPRLNRRSDRVLAGEDAPRSRSHHAYAAT